MSLLIYVNRAITKDNSDSSFFPQFMMYLDSGSYLCKCLDCKTSHSQSAVELSSASDFTISSDLTHYSDSDFTFTDEKLSNL